MGHLGLWVVVVAGNIGLFGFPFFQAWRWWWFLPIGDFPISCCMSYANSRWMGAAPRYSWCAQGFFIPGGLQRTGNGGKHADYSSVENRYHLESLLHDRDAIIHYSNCRGTGTYQACEQRQYFAKRTPYTTGRIFASSQESVLPTLG